MNVSNEGRGSKEYKRSFRWKIITWFRIESLAGTLFLVLRVVRNDRGGLLSCEVHMAHAISVRVSNILLSAGLRH